MNSVLFFIQNGWAFGTIHHGLIKRLWEHRIYSNLLDWSVPYTRDEHSFLRHRYRQVCTTIDGITHLLNAGWPASMIIGVAHSERDLVLTLSQYDASIVNQLKGFAVVNPNMVPIAAELGFTRIPTVVKVGIDSCIFEMPLPRELKTVGYAGAHTFHKSDKTECKRAHLIPQVVDGLNVALKEHALYNHLAMPGYYGTFDALLVTSSYESIGLPAIEAAAAGRLTFGAKVGYFDGSYGHLCRTPDDEFVADARKAIEEYTADPRAFRMACINARKAVRENHDWSQCITDWVGLFD